MSLDKFLKALLEINCVVSFHKTLTAINIRVTYFNGYEILREGMVVPSLSSVELSMYLNELYQKVLIVLETKGVVLNTSR